ncbi:cytochrome P450 [Actinoplanes lutulentus]|uniref:Cytochrome P450 n=1 Tax=Actinoplanes lutulentus TaxID=1287878 RepID=A0A327YXN2_9ACTN|nr:cytochrome P450 [Actinoplanes lutulentus]MBB2946467.1 cytochrome P450 [Actinoplanes lutulentus]RAK24750.1 cytochrome P450 [Actinoplanes lutulentus]
MTDDTVAATITPEFKADAPRQFAALRAGGPVRRIRLGSGLEAWAVLSYEEARAALTHPHLRKDPEPALRALESANITGHKVGEGFGGSMLFTDPPDHTRLRRLVAPTFSARRTGMLAGRIQEITSELLDAMEPSDEVDLIESFCAPLPMTVISELLGVPVDERAQFRVWSQALVGIPSAEQREYAGLFHRYLAELVERKRAAPSGDLLSDLIAQRDEDDGRLSQAEVIAMAALLVVAGHDTTVNLLGNAVMALLRQPEQADLLRAKPDLIAGAVEEFLRLDSSVEQATFRFAAEDLELGGVPIRRGDVVAVYLAAASRDAPQEDDADLTLLDVTRPNARHLAFGHGIHHCIGAPLARMEASIALGSLLRRFPGMRPAIPLTDVAWIPNGMMRGPLSLPVRLHR